MNKNLKLQKPPALGLPPMELAESTSNDRASKICANPFMQRILGGVILFLIAAGSYILLLTLLQYFGNTRTEIIIVTSPQAGSNFTVDRSNIEIHVEFKNKTTPTRRMKRELTKENSDEDKNKVILNENKMNEARDMVMNYDVPCSKGNTVEICRDLVTKLKSLNADKQPKQIDDSNSKISLLKVLKANAGRDVEELTSTEKSKRQTRPLENIEMLRKATNFHAKDSYAYENEGPLQSPHQIFVSPTKDCLIKKSFPHSVYGSQPTDYLPIYYDNPPAYSNFHRFSPATIPSSYFQGRDTDSTRRKMHPQDYEILQTIIGKTPQPQKHIPMAREVECPPGSLPCDSGDACIEASHWCNGKVECTDASDESRCSCKSRVDRSRICDGYFDCPSGEDETGCNGCSDTMFSCEDLESQSTCFTKEQRCNNVADCPNHRDEVDCTMLAPSLHKKPMFAISNTEGFLHRNFQGDWYAVCKNPYMWAHDACRRETGLIIRPPFIEVLPIDPFIKVDYLSAGPGGVIETGNACFNSSAIYVTCPDLLCGTRIMTTSQILRQDAIAESRLFGRNKRGSLPFMFPSQAFRYTLDPTADFNSNTDNERAKRTESRVVGGKASRPAAWPWMVAMYRDGTFHCGGVVLTQAWVMSAAHCVHKFWEHYYEIQVGMLRRFSFSPQEQNRLVTHVIVNHKYNKLDMKNDVSLLKVKPSIQFSRWVRPICLPGPETAGPDWLWGPPPGTICTAVGWGATVEHGPDPDHMREVEVPVWTECKHREDKEGKEICAGLIEGGKDACQGDSGGPLLCKNPLNSQQWYMAGIVSHGDGCGRKDEPGVYTRVSLFVKWIRFHINSKSLPTIQPKQECPGFKCISGISKCLPTKRMCDKTVDCLDGEDEINCSGMRTPPTFENWFLSSPKNIISERVNLETKVADTSSSEEITSSNSHKTDVETIQDTQNSDSMESPEKQSIIENTTFKITTETLPITTQPSVDRFLDFTTKNIDHDLPQVLSNETNLSTHSASSDDIFSTRTEITTNSVDSFPQSSENVENITTDPESLDTVKEEETGRGDLQSFTTTLSQEFPESRSSVSKSREADINEFSKTFSKESTTFPSITNVEDVNGKISSKNKNNHTAANINNGSNTINEQNQSDETTTVINKNNHLTTLLENVDIESKDLLTDLPDSTEKHSNELLDNDNNSLDAESKTLFGGSDIVNKIKDIIGSQLVPAKQKRQHPVPNEFVCQRIIQSVPYSERCDRKADCEDGTDELGCTCVDYLSRFESKLVCDGIFDCADGRDEVDCYTCDEDQFLCKRSQLCLPNIYVCDGKPQCPQGEDELDCFALTNGQSITYDDDNRPQVNLAGFLTKKHANNWHVVCDDHLTIKQQEEAALHVCRYLGFSSANRHLVKYINIKEGDLMQTKSATDRRNRRNVKEMPIQFAYRSSKEDTARHIVIKEPEVLKERCVPNVTRTCQSLYVFCDPSLYNNFEISNDVVYRTADTTMHTWPWVAKVYADGEYKCTGILVDLSWVLVSHLCLWDTILSHERVTAILGSHRTLSATKGMYEQTYQVDSIKDLYHNRVALLHLKEPAFYSIKVKPMVVSSSTVQSDKPIMCVALGQDENNNTVGLFLEETMDNCYRHSRCFVRSQNSLEPLCDSNSVRYRQWAGIVSCLSEQGWYPVATFVDSRGECGIGDKIIGTEIGGLKNELKMFINQARSVPESIEENEVDLCNGVRCGRGRCVKMQQVCDGVRHCEDGNDENEEACEMKHRLCTREPYNGGCECSSGQMKCLNGKCIAKDLYGDGTDDCGDNSDEPKHNTCAEYLSRVEPGRVCDGILHCKDRSDEDPMYCKCFAKNSFNCSRGYKNVNHCVAHDMVCDGIKDCPNGEDEQLCIGLGAPQGYGHGKGQVIVRSHGVWYSKCYPTQNHTKSELEDICRRLGFISGHAKKIDLPPDSVQIHNSVLLDSFSDVILNNKTMISIRNSNEPIAAPFFNENMTNCYPVFIECI